MKTVRHLTILLLLLFFMVILNCKNKQKPTPEKINKEEFPGEMVEFIPNTSNPVFEGTGKNTWDRQIRERGYILFEDGIYKLWYTGYNGPESVSKYLGYATSNDGITWTRYSEKPIFSDKWTEDMFVIKNEGIYYMYAEGENDIAHLLVSDDGINWNEQGDLVIRKVNGESIPGPYGTPTAWIENGKWYLFYERNDEGIWLARSTDHKNWTNILDEPVIKKGPGGTDATQIAANQVIKYKGRYYIYYHGYPDPKSADNKYPALWTSNVAMSTDLIHWVKYPENPIVEGDHSSPVMVFDGNRFRLYTMHPDICLFFSK
jgi:beta-1,2-mannobiose phosphorylase / 1,2-beta-oligomannan phosphorylase